MTPGLEFKISMNKLQRTASQQVQALIQELHRKDTGMIPYLSRRVDVSSSIDLTISRHDPRSPAIFSTMVWALKVSDKNCHIAVWKILSLHPWI